MRDAVGSVRSVLLLGGRSEIGLAVVERLVREGAREVVLAARGGAEAPHSLAALGPKVHSLDFDAAQYETHAATVGGAVELVGDLDVVVDAFGVPAAQIAGTLADPATHIEVR